MKTVAIKTPHNWKDLQPHPLSELIEFGKGISVEAMAAHMKAYGYDEDEAVVVFEGMILDGRHRTAACKLAGIIPTFREFRGKNAMAYVSKKLFRQYPTVAERAKMAATYATLVSGARASSNDEGGALSNAAAAKKFGVSTASVQRAKAAAKITCDRCTRIGVPVSDCVACKELRKLAGQTKRAANGTKSTRSKNGEIIDHKKLFEHHYGAMVRLIQGMSVALGKVEKLPAAGARRCMNELHRNFTDLLGLYKGVLRA